jgi:hypothetical protein
MRRARWFAAFAIVIAVAELWFAIQLRTWHGRGSWVGEPSHKVLIATWLASELWIDPVLLLIGITTLIVAVVLFVLAPRSSR